MNTGHDGSMTTIHANAARDALVRLENMVISGNPNLPLRFVFPHAPAIPVTILGDTRVDVRAIDLAGARFGPGAAPALWLDLLPEPAVYRDVDGDGIEDASLFFDEVAANLGDPPEPACLVGEIDGAAFEACEEPEAAEEGCGKGGEIALLLPLAIVVTRRTRRRIG